MVRPSSFLARLPEGQGNPSRKSVHAGLNRSAIDRRASTCWREDIRHWPIGQSEFPMDYMQAPAWPVAELVADS